MRRVRIGISVGTDRVALIATRGPRVLVAAAAGVEDDQGLQEVLGDLLLRTAGGRFPRPHATLVLGPARAQLRVLSGLPESADAGLLARVVGQDPGRLFLRNGTPLVTTGIRPLGPGEAWGAALDEGAIRAVQRACDGAGVRLQAAAPAVVALAQQAPDGSYGWVEGEVSAELEVVHGAISAYRRRRDGAAEGERLPVPPALAPLGEEGAAYLDAYAATQLSPREPLATRFAAGDVPGWRVALAAAALVVALAGALVLPERRTAQAARAAAGELERGAPTRRAAERESAELGEVTAALGEVERFAAPRRSAVALVAGLARVLPEGSALVSVHADSAGGTLVALTPRAADVLAQVDRLPGVASPSLSGPVTREVIAGSPLERVAIRFHWGPR